MPLRYLAVVVSCWSCLAVLESAGAQTSAATSSAPSVSQKFDVREQYTKYEYQVSMRDGVRLFTAVYLPKNVDEKYPILLRRSPYSCKPYGVDQYPDKLGPSELLAKSGYIFVFQDVRGRWMSEGELENMRPHLVAIPTTRSSGCSRTWRATTAASGNGASHIRASTLPAA